MSQIVSPENALWGLLHDSAEAYVNDISTPLRKIINGDYEKIHDRILSVICERYGLKGPIPEEVRLKDRWVTVNELWCLIDRDFEEPGIPRLWDEIRCWSPEEAKGFFLQRFNELRKLLIK